MIITISNDNESVTLEVIRTTIGIWRDSSIFKLSDYISLADPLTLSVAVSDDPQNGHVVEGAFDEFRVVDKISTSTESQSLIDWKVSPSPFSDHFMVSLSSDDLYQLNVLSLDGRRILNQADISGQVKILTNHWASGTYVVRITNSNGETATERIIKH
jgi:hypothetical protein